MSSVARRSACKAAWFLSLIAGVAVVPASATTATITLVPAITTLTGDGTPGYPGRVPILATSATPYGPIAVVTDTEGNVYFSDQNLVWKITRSTGIMAIIAGIGYTGHAGDGGPATAATFSGTQGLKFDSAGNLYIVDSGNSAVRRVDHVSGNIATVAGTIHSSGSTGDGGLATSAKLVGPSYIAFDAANNLYIGDSYGNSIRRVDAVTQIITTVAGDPTSARAAGQTGDGGLATGALLNHPNGLSFDQGGNLYIADRGNNAVRRIDAATGIITTVAGDPSPARAAGATGDGGPAANSTLEAPLGVYVDTGGNLFIADSGNSVVREVTNDGKINTVAGLMAASGFSGDGGAATAALLTHPADIAFDTEGNLFIADNYNATVRDVNLYSTFPATAVGSTSASQNLVLHLTGTLTINTITVPLSQGGSAEYAVGSISGTGCSLGSPITVTSMAGLNCMLPATFHPAYPGVRGVPLVFATLVSSIPKTFRVGMSGPGLGPQIAFMPALITTVAGNGTAGAAVNGGAATLAELNKPLGLAADYQGSLYISDTFNFVVRRVDGSSQTIGAFAGNGTSGSSGDGALATGAEFASPEGLAIDSAGDVYISDAGNDVIREVSTNSGIIAAAAGAITSPGSSGDRGAATSALLSSPSNNALDSLGNLYIADSANNKIRRIDARSGIITTVAGDGTPGYSGDLGFATLAQLHNPAAVVIDAAGNLYISDAGNNVIREVTASTGIITTIAGVAGAGGYSGDGGPATSALLNDSQGLALDAAGNLYITDSSNNLVREVDALTGIISTVAGSTVSVPAGNSGYSGDNGPANAALLRYPAYPAVDSAGGLYITDNGNSVIRKIAGVAPLSFGSIALSASSPAQDVTIANNGSTNLTLTALTAPADFNLSGADTSCTGSTVLAPAASCVLGIKFVPTVTGALNETLTITDNQGSQTIPLGGTGLPPPTATTTTVTVAPNPSVSGGNVTFTATIAPAPTGSSLGTVNFYNNGVLLGPGNVAVNSSGVATYPTTTLSVGTDAITAVYSGNTSYTPSTSAAFTATVTPPAGAVTLVLSPTSAAAGTVLTLTATVLSGSTPVHPGTVNFCDATALFCEGPALLGIAQLNSSGIAIFKFIPGPGTYSIKAVFSGTATTGAATSAPQPVTIAAAAVFASTTAIASSGAAGDYTLTGTVSAFGLPAPTGTVSFLDSSNAGAVITTATLAPATLTFGFTPAAGPPLADPNSLNSAVTGDFNNDGILDIAVVESHTPTVNILLGKGDGTFQTPVSYNLADYGNGGLAAGDFNGDGKLDIVAASNHSVSVLLGNGDGTFQTEVTYHVGPNNNPNSGYVAYTVAVADFNHDGILDLAVVNGINSQSPSTVSILLGNGDGTFQTQSLYAAGVSPESVAVGDFNGDGKLDLAVCSVGTSATLSVLLGNGDGSFQAPVGYPSVRASYIVAADFNKDGKLDLLTDNVDDTVSVLLGNGDGTFQSAANYAAYPYGDAVVGDFNADGKLDVATANAADSSIGILYGNGDGTFQPLQGAWVAGSHPFAAVAGDFNGDGLIDLFVNNSGDSTDSTLLNQQIETATATQISIAGVGAHNVLASYSGDTSHTASQSSTVALTGSAVTATTSLLTVSPNPVAAGQSATFTLTITPAPTGSPLGTVSFYNGGTLLGTGTLNGSGVATFSTTTLPAGSDLITASYSGNHGFASSSSPAITVQVNSANAAATVTTVTSSNLAPNYGQSITLTATVTPAPTSAPPGTIRFYAGTTLLGTQAINAQGIATLSLSLPLGPNAITAVYSGSAGFAPSTSSALSVSARALSAITFAASPTTQLATMPVIFTAQVSSATTGVQTGTISFLNGSTVLATVTLVAGQPAVYSETGLPSGVYSVTASYSGDGSFLPSASTGAPIAITVSNLDLALGGDNNQTVVPGGAVTYNFPLSPVLTPTFLYNVALTATGLPPGATYTFSPASIPAGSGTLPVAFTVQTAKTTAMLRSSKSPWFALVFGLLLPLAGAKRLRARITTLPRMLLLLLFGALSLGLVAGLGGCGSGGFLGTPPGQTSYTITINATSGTLVRTTTVQLNLE